MKQADPFYLSAEWQRLRKGALQRDGYRCVVPGCGERAVVVDHILSRAKGGADTLANMRCLCRGHDNQVKEGASGERRNGGRLTVKGCGTDGWPADPEHPWRKP